METLYSIYDPDTRVITHCEFAEELPENGSAILVCAPWAKPVLNAEGTAIENMATPEEQATFEAAQLALKWGGITEHTNEELTTPQSSESLNAVYQGVQPSFKVIAPYVDGGQEYIKVTDSQWRRVAVEMV